MEQDLKGLITKFLYLYLTVSVFVIFWTYNVYTPVAYLHILLAIIMILATLHHKMSLQTIVNAYVNHRIATVESVAKSSFRSFPVAILIVTRKNAQIKWHNDEFNTIFDLPEESLDMPIFEYIPEITEDIVKNHSSQFPCELEINDKIYRVFSVTDADSKNIVNLYFLDVTTDVNIRTSFEESRPIVSIISIDNYDELLRNSSDTEKSIIVAAINTRISDWTDQAKGIFKKIDRDKYLFIFSNSAIENYITTKFPILDTIRQIQTLEGVTATLSIGIGRDGDDFAENYEFALNSLDMALSRGGDQVVIKNKSSFEFFGGASKEIEKRTKVKSRVIANTLNQIIKDSSEVYVMGHNYSDYDSLGSALGICAAIRANDKPHKIIIDLNKTSSQPLIDLILKHEQYKDIFITPDDALIQLNPDTLLIVVDTNRPDYVESRAVLDSATKVVVIDHHRRAADYIENATVNMHEPYASSAAEIVTELLQYMVNTSKITKVEAEALLSGIMLDTKQFASKTNSRTFEAAAYLRRIGADIDIVKQLFQNDFDSYLLKQQLTANAKIYLDKYVIVTSPIEVSRPLASQSADELLDITDIEASFVIFRDGNRTNISARSNSKVNVQVVMEKLGGGGSMTAAACQFDGDTTENVERLLKEVLDDLA